MKYTTWDRCPECKGEITLHWNDDIHGFSGVRHVKCPCCEHEFDIKYGQYNKNQCKTSVKPTLVVCGLCGVIVKDPTNHVVEEEREIHLCERCFDVYLQILRREGKLPTLEGR